MGVGTTRKGVTQARFNDEASNIIFSEIFILSVVVGIYFNSWYIFGGTIIGFMVCMFIPVINILMGILLSTLWALIGARVVCFLKDIDIPDPSNTLEFLGSVLNNPASQVVAGIIFLSSLGAHLSTIEWIRDNTDTKERNLS